MKFGRNFGILIDIPIERYYSKYPSLRRDRVGFELYAKLSDKI